MKEVLHAAALVAKAGESVGGGLPPPEVLVGSKFYFGDDSHFIVGVIESMGYGIKEGIRLRVSPPRFRGIEIKYISCDEGVWTIHGTSGFGNAPGVFFVYHV